jgi:predicted acyltransferase
MGADNIVKPDRLLSLDFMRGLIMVLLALESTGLYWRLTAQAEGTVFHGFMLQFEHHEWHGLHFWDLIQPGFMFIAGTALAFSLQRQLQNGQSWGQSFIKALKRSGWLFFWGVLDYAVRKNGLSFELWDVLTQLSFTLLVAFLIYRWTLTVQLIFSIALLLLTELLYRYAGVSGFDQPFTDQQNFGNYIDLILMNKINGGGWVAINCLPTAAHTIWGMMAGKILLGNRISSDKLKVLIAAGICCLVLGHSLDLAGITPIIKKIATSSFVLVSGGWCFLTLAFLYWWIDVLDHKKYLQFFLILGMNSIFIYLFFEIVGSRWFNGYVFAVTGGLMDMAAFPESLRDIISSLCIFALEWGLCYFLYKKRIFFRA